MSDPSFVINKKLFDCKSKIEEMTAKRDHHYQTLRQTNTNIITAENLQKRRIVFILLLFIEPVPVT